MVHSDNGKRSKYLIIIIGISDDREVPGPENGKNNERNERSLYQWGRCTKNTCVLRGRGFYGGLWRLRVIPGHRNSCSHRRLNPTGVGGPFRTSPVKVIDG